MLWRTSPRRTATLCPVWIRRGEVRLRLELRSVSPNTIRLRGLSHHPYDGALAAREAGGHIVPLDEANPDGVALGLLAAPGVWRAVRAAIEAVGARHKHKRFRIEFTDDYRLKIEINGHSAKDVATLLALAAAEQERLARTREAPGEDQPDTAPPSPRSADGHGEGANPLPPDPA